MTETTPSPESKPAILDAEDEVIETLIQESGTLTLHPLMDYHSQTGLTFGVVYENPKPQYKNDYRAIVIIQKQVKFLNFKSSGHFNELPIQLLSRRQRPFELSPNTKKDLTQIVRELRKGLEIERKPIFDVYNSLLQKATLYIFHPDPRWHKFLASYFISTYCHQLFSPYPNVSPQGARSTGKSALADLTNRLAWNPSPPASGLRAAPLFRKAEGRRATMIFDATKVDVRDPEVADIFEVIDKEGVIERCIGKDNVPWSFHPFCPKIIAARFTVPFRDKTIVIPTEAPPTKAELKMYTERKQKLEMDADPELHAIASDVLRSVICHWKEILESYGSIQQSDVLYGRRFELWRPILAVCKTYSPNDYKDLESLAEHDALTSTKGDILSDVEDTVIGVLLDWEPGATAQNLTFKLKDITQHVQVVLGTNVVRNYKSVQSAIDNLHIVRSTYKSGDHVTYEIDMEAVKKTAAERGVTHGPPIKEDEVLCQECGRVIKKDEPTAALTGKGHAYCQQCICLLTLAQRTVRQEPTVASDRGVERDR